MGPSRASDLSLHSADRMNVLEVVIGPYPQIRGGVDKMVALLVDGLVAEGCAVTVFVPGLWEAATLGQENAGGVSVYTLRLRRPVTGGRALRSLAAWLGELPRTLRAQRGICRRHRIDVIHIHTATNYCYWFRLLRWLGGPPYVITFHRGDVVDFATRWPLDRFLIRCGLAGAAATNAVSRWLAVEARRVFPGLCDPAPIYNGIAEMPRAAEAAPGTVAALVGDKPYFIMVGTFDPYKGHDVAIRAWGLLPEGTRPHLLIVGEGELRQSYERLIEEVGGGDCIHLTGQLPNQVVQQLLASATAMVFPSRSEGLPYVALEAGLARLPLVCSHVPPFDEIVDDGESGILFRPEDPADLAAAVLRLTGDPALRERLGEALRRTVETRFSVEAMVRGYRALFDQAASIGRR